MSQAESRATSSMQPRRRTWTLDEEKNLVLTLEEIVERGLRGQKGFRTGYLLELEKIMKRLNPLCDLRADPHIHSNIHAWECDHKNICDMIGISGFEWNEISSQLIIKDDTVWDAYVKANLSVNGMHYKRYPFFARWRDIFGNDRATGQNAEDVLEARTGRGRNQIINDNEHSNASADVPSGNNANESHPTTSDESTASGKKRRKRKNLDGTNEVVDKMCQLMIDFSDRTDARLGQIVVNMGYECKMMEKRNALGQALEELGVLSLSQLMTVSSVLVANNKQLELFFSFSHDNRVALVMHMLGLEV